MKNIHSLSTVFLVISACMLLGAVLGVSLITPVLFQSVLIPLAVRFFSPDGSIGPEGTSFLYQCMKVEISFFLFAGIGMLMYALLLRLLESRLSDRKKEIDSSSTQPFHRSDFCVIGTAIMALAILGTLNIGRGLGKDEIFTTIHFINTSSWWQTVSSYISTNNHIGYSLFARFFTLFLGVSEWSVRFPALLLGLAGIPLFWMLVKSVANDRRLAAFSAFLLAINPSYVLYCQSARGGTGSVTFSILSTLAFVSLLRRPHVGSFAVYVIANSLAIYFHGYGIFVIVVHCVWLHCVAAAEARIKSSSSGIDLWTFTYILRAMVLSVSLSVLVYAPVLRKFIKYYFEYGTGYQVHSLSRKLLFFFANGEQYTDISVPVFFIFLLIVGVSFGLVKGWRNTFLFLMLSIFPLIVVELARPEDMVPRFFLVCLPFFLYLISLGLRTLWNVCTGQQNQVRKWAGMFASTILVMAIGGRQIHYSAYNIAEEGYRPIVDLMENEAREQSLLCSIGSNTEHFQFYAKKKLFIPESYEEFSREAAKYKLVLCAFSPVSEQYDHDRIAELLERKAYKRQFGLLALFVLQGSELGE